MGANDTWMIDDQLIEKRGDDHIVNHQRVGYVTATLLRHVEKLERENAALREATQRPRMADGT